MNTDISDFLYFVDKNSNNSVQLPLPPIREHLCGFIPFVMRIFEINNEYYVTLHDIHWCICHLIKDPTKDIQQLRECYNTEPKFRYLFCNTALLIKSHPLQKKHFGDCPKCIFISIEEIIRPSGYYFSFLMDRFIMHVKKNTICFANKSINV